MVKNGMVMALLAGDIEPKYIRVTSIDGSVSPQTYEITESKHNEVMCLDGEPIVDVLARENFEVGKTDVLREYLLTPFIVTMPQPDGGEIQAARNLSLINHENKSGVFLGAMPEGSKLQIGFINKDGVMATLDEALKFEYEKSEAGYFMSDKTADTVIKQCDEFTAEGENHFLIESFDERIDQLTFLSDKEKEDFKKRDKEAVLNSAIPAFQDIKKTLQELKGTGKNELGICNYEGGRDYYSGYLFPFYSGSSKTCNEEITVMESRQQNLVLQLSAVYYANPDAYKSFTDNYNTLQSDYDKMSATELLDYFMENVMDEYPELSSIPYKANYLDKHMEKIMDQVLAYYMSPPIDDKENNLIYVNGAHTDGMWTTLSHEGCPGHMYQNTFFQSTNPKPIRAIQGNLGYMEGWAVYASYKTLSKCDFGGSEYAQQYAQLYKINEDLGYLLYGRIDLGVNFEGWNLDDVKKYLETSGYSSDGAEEIMGVVIGDPGLYLSYTTGYYEMEELRNYAEQELGSKFDEKEYHKAILTAGPCQYKELRTVVDKYIEENK